MKRIATMCYMMLLAVTLQAADVSLAWDASPTETVTNYRIYRGNAPRTYSTYDHLGNVLTHTVTDLPAGTWYFTATALDAEGNESDYSNEVSTTIAPAMSCDVNGDASINVLDLQSLVNLLVSGGAIDLMFDLNSDGVVNILDVQILANVIAGTQICP